MIRDELSVGVVICCYTERRWDLLAACVGAVMDQARGAGAKVLLVVDHSPALQDRCAAAFPGVLVVGNRYQRGLSGARNTGVESLDTEIVLFVDDDAIPGPGWLAALRAAFADPDLLAVGGEVRPVWPTSERPGWLPPEFDWAVGCDYVGMASLGQEIRNPIGANMGLRRAAVVAAGGFRPVLGRQGAIPSGCEETDLAIRMRARTPSGSIRRIPGAPVDHHLTADRCTGSYLIRRCFAEGGSKATLMRLEGAGRAISAEADHALGAIPRAVARDIAALARGERAAARRIWWTVAGLAAAVTGWALGLLRRGPRTPPDEPEEQSWAPVWCVDIADPAPALPTVPSGARPDRVHLLVRAGGRPVGQLEVTVPGGRDLPGFLLSSARNWSAQQQLPASAPSWPAGSTSVSVVICTLGRAGSLATAVDAVLSRQTRPAHEVIVVDNDPDAGRVVDALARFAGESRLRIVTAAERGVSRARNAGVAAATGDVVAFTDDDVEAEPDWLARLAEVFDSDPGREIGCVTGLVVPADLGLATHRWFEQSSGFERGYLPMVWGPADSGVLDRLREYEPLAGPGRRGPAYPVAGSEFGSGNNMALRRELLVAAGGFDVVLGTGSPARGGEDLDMLRRVVLGGAALVYHPSAVVRHHHRATIRQLRRQMYDYGVGMCANVLRYATGSAAGLRATLRVLPGGVRLLLDPASAKNSGKADGYPRALTFIELAGYLTGPVHLLRSLRTARRTGTGAI
ncbi:glycosyltransferase family 2 protein [Nocardia flavorosea]|uniref:Glycosyltransferase n=1 Tax=Nocardia flavorosea TaxID=53429 RepID=A0A846YE98_9NOCA|nr:glycosyltransferase [Nocardia flavorosea]NKY57005.1 glycosyltransferase [Nocardia flavorosea]